MNRVTVFRTTTHSTLLDRYQLLVLAAVAALFFALTGTVKADSCPSSSVATQSELDAAIAAFNTDTSACLHTITLSDNILLSTATTEINNDYAVSDAELIIQGAGFSIDGPNTYGVRCLTIAADSIVALNQITVTSGGISNAGTLTVTNSTISGNQATAGGGIDNRGTLNITNSTLSNNQGFNGGGGIYNDGMITMTDSTVSDNQADYFAGGGGIYSYEGTVVVINSIFSGNRSGEWGQGGGGIHSSGTVSITNSTFTNNHASSDGGGICKFGGVLAITNSNLSGNQAERGGGVYNYEGKVVIANSTISGNRASSDGGGFYSDGLENIINSRNTINVANSTLSGNQADYGGGIYNYDGTWVITNSTFSGNQAASSGGGIYSLDELTLNNSIIANSSNGDCRFVSGTVIGFSSLIRDSGDDACSLVHDVNGNIIDVDPLLGPLADNGGPTQTHFLSNDSPGVDAGNDALAVDADGQPLTADQRGAGYARILGARVDIGAIELSAHINLYLPLIDR